MLLKQNQEKFRVDRHELFVLRVRGLAIGSFEKGACRPLSRVVFIIESRDCGINMLRIWNGFNILRRARARNHQDWIRAFLKIWFAEENMLEYGPHIFKILNCQCFNLQVSVVKVQIAKLQISAF